MRAQDSLEAARQEVLILSGAFLQQQQKLAAALAERDSLLAQLAQQRERWQELEQTRTSLKQDAIGDADRADVLARALAALLSRRYWEAAPDRGGLRGWLAGRWPRLGRLLGKESHGDRLREREQVRMIEASALFDGAWYLRQNPDVAQAGVSPALHYLRNGAQEGRDPGPRFSTSAYLAEHGEHAIGTTNPLIHCLVHAGEAAG